MLLRFSIYGHKTGKNSKNEQFLISKSPTSASIPLPIQLAKMKHSYITQIHKIKYKYFTHLKLSTKCIRPYSCDFIYIYQTHITFKGYVVLTLATAWRNAAFPTFCLCLFIASSIRRFSFSICLLFSSSFNLISFS